MPRFAVALFLALALGADSRALAAPWSVGVNVDLTKRDAESGASTTFLGGPGAPGDLQPGLRLGLEPGNGAQEVFLNGGLATESASGRHDRWLMGTANYQYNFAGGVETGPFVTIGCGVIDRRFTDRLGTTAAATSSIVGVGMGIRHWVADGHGAVRLELRYDRVGASRGGGIGAMKMLSLRLGFDLWTGRAHGRSNPGDASPASEDQAGSEPGK